jgi:hypothetical protein
LRRFAGWATSIPLGGTRVTQRAEANRQMRKAFTSLPFVERRVIVDQGHKLTASIHDIVATDGGAIAGIWHSHWREIGYDYREDHKGRDRLVYVIRNNWAMKRGLMRLAGREYIDQITQPAEEVYCRCYYEYLYTLRDLPDDMLTTKGCEELKRVRRALGLQAPGCITY